MHYSAISFSSRKETISKIVLKVAPQKAAEARFATWIQQAVNIGQVWEFNYDEAFDGLTTVIYSQLESSQKQRSARVEKD